MQNVLWGDKYSDEMMVFLLLIHELDVNGYQTNTSMNVRKDVNECDRLEDRDRTSKPRPGRRAS